MQLKVLVYNVEYGGALVSLKKTEAAIRLADADVVGLLEPYENLPRIAKATGYPYYNMSLQIISKYPIHEPSGADGLYALVEVQPGHVVAFGNIHLDYVRDGPSALLRGKAVDAVIATENVVRTSAMAELLRVLPPLAEQGYPVFLTGDFNEPSSLDYVTATVGLRPQIVAPVAWPVSEALFAAGFRDSYRDANPDPVANPGVTWPAERPRVAAWAGNPSAKRASRPDRLRLCRRTVHDGCQRDLGREGRSGRGAERHALAIRPSRGRLDLRPRPGGHARDGRRQRPAADRG